MTDVPSDAQSPPQAMDPGANLAGTRAALVAGAMQFLGPERERHAEVLADRVLVYLNEVYEAGCGVLDPNGTPEQLGERMRDHSRQLCLTAHECIVWTMLASLEVALHP